MHELDSITVYGFKSIAAMRELKLRAINVVIGPNGAGKSNFIGVFSFLHAVREGHLQEYVARAGGADRVLHFGADVSSELRVHVSFEGGKNQYEVVLGANESDQLYPQAEIVHFRDEHGALFEDSLPRRGMEAGISDPSLGREGKYVREHLDRWRVYHFDDAGAGSPMKKTADVNDNRYLRPDASNIAAFLYLLRERHPGPYGLIRRTVRLVAPFFDDFQLEPQRLNPEKIRLEWKHEGSEGYFDAASLSDGTLRFIALATLFLQPLEYRPSVILVDEPELGLHPQAITLLASLVKQAAAHTQVILSTQSPHLLNRFDPEDVLVAERADGGTGFTRLESAPLAEWLEDYSLGELWQKNELGGWPRGERPRG